MLPHSCVNSGRRQLFPSRSGGRSWEAWHPQLFITSPQTGTCECPLTCCSTDLVLRRVKYLCSVFRGTIVSPIWEMVVKDSYIFLHLKTACIQALPLPFWLLIIIPWGVWTDCFSLRAMQRNSLSIGKLWPSASGSLPQMISCNIRHWSWPTFRCCSLLQLFWSRQVSSRSINWLLREKSCEISALSLAGNMLRANLYRVLYVETSTGQGQYIQR